MKAIESSVMQGLRDIGASHEIIRRMGHTGWFSDACEQETIAGHVWQLPAHKGETRYLAGYDEGNGYAVVDVSETYADKEDAARAADECARIAAETNREYDEKWLAASTLQTCNEGDRVDLKAYRARFSAMADACRVLKHDADATKGIREVMDEARDNFNECLARIIERNESLADFAADGVEV